MYFDSFKAHFQSVGEPRQSVKVSHPLFDIVYGTLCAVISGAKGWTNIRADVLGHHEWFLS